jgi:hypothetical protein
MACTGTRLKDSIAETADSTFGIGAGVLSRRREP